MSKKIHKYIFPFFIFLFILSDVSAQDSLSYQDFLYGKVNLSALHERVTLEKRNHYLSLMDSFPYYAQVFEERMAKDPDSIMHAIDYASNLMTVGQIYLVVYEHEKALEYADQFGKLCRGYKKQYRSQINHHRYEEFNIGIVTSHFMKSMIHLLAGEVESSYYHAKKCEQLSEDLSMAEKWKKKVKADMHYLYTAQAMLNKECYRSHKNVEMLVRIYNNPETKKRAEKDTSQLKNYYENRFNALQYKLLALSCTCDSLSAMGKHDVAIEYIKENGIYFESFFEANRDRNKYLGLETLDYSATTFGCFYYTIVGDYDNGNKFFKENDVSKFDGFQKIVWYKDYAQFLLERDSEKSLFYTNKGKEELKRLSPFDKPNQSLNYQTTYLGLLLLDAINAEFKYLRSKDVGELIKSHQLYGRIYKASMKIRELQASDISAFYIESQLKDVYDKAAINAYLCYKELGERSYLHDCIRYSENSKSFLLRKNNAQIINEQFRNSKTFQKLFVEERQLSNRLKFFQGQIGNTIQDSNKNLLDSIFVYRDAKNAFNNKVIKEFPEYYRWKHGNINLDIAKIQESLGEDLAVFSYMEDPNTPLLNIITQKNIKTFALDSMKYWIDDLKSYNQTIHEGGFKKYKKLGAKIYDALLGEGISGLPENIKRIVIIPDGEINELNVGSLPLPDNMDSQYLIEKYAISYQYSLEMLDLEATKRNEDVNYDFMAFIPEYKGNIEGDKLRCANSPLSHAAKSAMASNDLFKNAKSFEKASVQNVEENAFGARILHFAAHGCVSDVETPLHYNLLMTLGEGNKNELSVVDIYDLKLNSDLTVLAACESGKGQLRDGIGVYSIARAFHYAGCPNTIATTAVVNEESTSEILLDFYQFLLSGDPLDIALQKAKIAYLEKNDERNEPYIWTNIILIGNPIRINFD